MKKLFSLIIVQALFLFTTLSGIIVEAKNFKDILEHITPNTLVLLDIDDTLIIPTQTLGSDAWFIYQYKQHLTEYPRAVAFDKTLAEWEAIRHLTEMKIVEEGTDKIVQELQERNIVVMCLTTQGLALATRTVNQLKTLGIDPSKTAPSAEDHYFINQHGVLYRDGVLFTSGTPKGSALNKLLDILDLHPEHVLFINDKLSHVLDLESGLIQRNIPFAGLRYAYSDERVENFNPKIADVQWKYSNFGKILSDDEAQEILSKEF